MVALLVELMLVCDLGEVLHDGLEALMVGGFQAGFRLRPRLVLRLVLEDLVSQTALPCSDNGGPESSISSAYLGAHGRAHGETRMFIWLCFKTSQAAVNTARREGRREKRRKIRRTRMQRDTAGGR